MKKKEAIENFKRKYNTNSIDKKAFIQFTQQKNAVIVHAQMSITLTP